MQERPRIRPLRLVVAWIVFSAALGLIYLAGEPRRLTMEEIDLRHPRLIPALRSHPHIAFVLVRSAVHGAVVLGPRGIRHLLDGHVTGEDPLVPFSPNAAAHLRRTDTFRHVPDLIVNSFYDPTRLAPPDEPLVGAAAVHDLFERWLGRRVAEPAPATFIRSG
jgi:hypothetical protein